MQGVWLLDAGESRSVVGNLSPQEMVMKMNLAQLNKHRDEILRAMNSHRYEQAGDRGIYLPKAKLFIGGHFESWVNGHDHSVEPNATALEGISYILRAAFQAGSQLSSWYIAPFSGTAVPGTSLTAATFTSVQTEFTNYTQSTRVAWTQDTEASQAISNSATKADFTIDTGGGTVWGAGILSASAKSATSGKLAAASKFSASRVLLAADVLTLQYTLSGADA